MQQHRTRAATDRYKELRREEKRTHKRKKRAFENNILEELEAQRNQNQTRKFYKNINNMRKEFKPRITMCKDKNGQILNSKEQILNRWAEHFVELLCKDNIDQDNDPLNENYEEIEPPTLQEVQEAIKRLKNNKSPGSDQIPSELFKNGGENLTLFIHKIIGRVWAEEYMPDEWQIGIICPLHKKGDQLDCRNYRGITLLNTIYKIFSNILYNRLSYHTETLLGEYQSGFRPGRSTVDQIFVLRQILEKTHEFNIDTFHLFIDFKAAYDSILRNKLYEAMNEFQIPSKLIRLVKTTMSKVICKVRIENDTSDAFQTNTGLRQGDALACLLFNIALEKTVRDANLENRGTIYNKSMQIMAYADDVDIVARTLRKSKETFEVFSTSAESMGLEINVDKTKLMASTPGNRAQNIGQNVNMGEVNVEVVQHFTYLGSLVNTENMVSDEIKRRIMLANKCYFGLSKHLRSRNLSWKTKTLIYKTLILPVLTYGSETWTISKSDENLLLVFERKILRKIFGAICENGHWRRRYNFELYAKYTELSNGRDIVTHIKTGRLRWAGHIARADENYPPKRIFKSGPVGTRRRGRPRLRWKGGVDEDAAKIGAANWQRLAMNRDEWRTRLKKVGAHLGL